MSKSTSDYRSSDHSPDKRKLRQQEGRSVRTRRARLSSGSGSVEGGEKFHESRRRLEGPMVTSFQTHKGGTGKTSAAWLLGSFLAKEGARVLYVDADAQCNLSRSFLKYLVFHTDLCQFYDDLAKRQIFRKLSRKILQTTGSEEGVETEYALSIDFLDSDELTCTSDEEESEEDSEQQSQSSSLRGHLHDWGRNRSLGKEFLLFRFDESWFVYGQDKNGEVDYFRINGLVEKILKSDRLRELEASTDRSLSEEESLQLLHIAASKLGQVNYASSQLYHQLICCEFVIKNEFDPKDQFAVSSMGDHCYVLSLSPDDDALTEEWVLYDIVKGDVEKVPLKNVNGLALLLEEVDDAIEPESIPKTMRDKLHNTIKNYVFINLFQYLKPNADAYQTVVEETKRLARRVSLLSIEPRRPPKGKTGSVPLLGDDGQQGKLFLLPGHGSLQLHLERRFSRAVEGISDSAQAPYANFIYEVRDLIRNLAKLHEIDFVFVDLNPSTSSLNETFVMTSDAFLTVVNPAEYSEDATYSLRDIAQKWTSDFKDLYTIVEPKSKYDPISQPPACLGLAFQKMTVSGNNLSLNMQREYRDEILETFKEAVIPVLMRSNMYTRDGVYGFNEEGHRHESESLNTHGIRVFTSELERWHKTGMPLSWLDATISHDIQKLLDRTIGRFVIARGDFPERIKKMFERVRSQQEERGVAKFRETWANPYHEWRKKRFSQRDRSKYIAQSYYRLDMVDMQVLIARLRSEVLEGSRYVKFYSNGKGVFLADPCYFAQLKDSLMSDLANIRSSCSVLADASQGDSREEDLPHYILQPFFYQCHWYCLRIEINLVKDSVDILFDDPYGGVLSKTDQVTLGNRQSRLLPEQFVKKVVAFVSEACKNHMRRLKRGRFYSIKHVIQRAKKLDQQGHMCNDSDSGVVILANIRDYLTKTDSNDELRPNSDFEDSASSSTKAFVSNIANIKDKPRLRLTLRAGSLSGARERLYTLRSYNVNAQKTSFESAKSRYEDFLSSPDVLQYRRQLAESFSEVPQQVYNKISNTYAGDNSIEEYTDFVRTRLGWFPENYSGFIVALFKKYSAKPRFPLRFILVSTFIRFCVRTNAPKKSFEQATPQDGSGFAKYETRYALKHFGINVSHSRKSAVSSSKSSIIMLDSDDDQSDSSPRVSNRGRLPRFSFTGWREGLCSVVGRSNLRFRAHQVEKNGDCGYTSFGITRQEAYNQLLRNRVKSRAVKDYVSNVILEQLHRDVQNQRSSLLDVFDEASVVIPPSVTSYLQDYYNSFSTESTGDLSFPRAVSVFLHDKAVQEAYLHADILEKRFQSGWAHPSILLALAYVRRIRLRIWRPSPSDESQLVPNGDGRQDSYHQVKPSGSTETKDIVYVRESHFELLEQQGVRSPRASSISRSISRVLGLEESSSSGSGHGDPSAASRQLSYLPPQSSLEP